MDALEGVGHQINLKFNVLTREVFMRTIQEGSRIIHLSSDVVAGSYLVLEKEWGLADYVGRNELEMLADSQLLATSGVEVVVLAIPHSESIAKFIYEQLGAKHVIYFRFDRYSQELDLTRTSV
jgi:hypothetical protein